MDYQAELHDVTIYVYPSHSNATLAYGEIYNDTSTRGNHPFTDGKSVRTSYVKEIKEVDGVEYLITENSVYKIVGGYSKTLIG